MQFNISTEMYVLKVHMWDDAIPYLISVMEFVEKNI